MDRRISAGNRGEMGVSTLIIFISVVLLAATAAGVLISIASSLQQDALQKSSEAEDSIGASFNVIHIMGSDGSDGDVEDFEVLMKLQAGSGGVHFNYTLVSASTGSWVQEMEYNGSGTTAVGTTMYYIEWIEEGPEYREDYLNNGDIVKLRFHTTSVTEGRKVKMRITPRNGLVSIIEFTTPMRLRESKVNLYPMAI